jgi:hypothetical protein
MPPLLSPPHAPATYLACGKYVDVHTRDTPPSLALAHSYFQWFRCTCCAIPPPRCLPSHTLYYPLRPSASVCRYPFHPRLRFTPAIWEITFVMETLHRAREWPRNRLKTTTTTTNKTKTRRQFSEFTKIYSFTQLDDTT